MDLNVSVIWHIAMGVAVGLPVGYAVGTAIGSLTGKADKTEAEGNNRHISGEDGL